MSRKSKGMSTYEIALYHERTARGNLKAPMPEHPSFDDPKDARDFQSKVKNPEWRSAIIRRGLKIHAYS